MERVEMAKKRKGKMRMRAQGQGKNVLQDEEAVA